MTDVNFVSMTHLTRRQPSVITNVWRTWKWLPLFPSALAELERSTLRFVSMLIITSEYSCVCVFPPIIRSSRPTWVNSQRKYSASFSQENLRNGENFKINFKEGCEDEYKAEVKKRIGNSNEVNEKEGQRKKWKFVNQTNLINKWKIKPRKIENTEREGNEKEDNDGGGCAEEC